jgi:hypothetical protein
VLYIPSRASLAAYSTSHVPSRIVICEPLATIDHQDRERAGAVANGFGRRSLHVNETHSLWDTRWDHVTAEERNNPPW